jgi:CRISPR-associated protein Csx16
VTRYFVTRHKGAKDWCDERRIVAETIAHLDSSMVKPGDEVLGTLPYNEAANVISRGARFFSLEMTLTAKDRGKDLTASEMEKCGARLVEYAVHIINSRKQQ